VRTRRALSLAMVVALMLALPGFASAQTGPGNPLSPGLPQGGGTTPTSATSPALPTTSTTATSGGTGLSGTSAIVIAIGALVILGGISMFIWRDARRRAPVRARAAGADMPGGGRPGSKARAKPRKLSPAERRRRKRGRAR
jgi:hypothetical protein